MQKKCCHCLIGTSVGNADRNGFGTMSLTLISLNIGLE